MYPAEFRHLDSHGRSEGLTREVKCVEYLSSVELESSRTPVLQSSNLSCPTRGEYFLGRILVVTSVRDDMDRPCSLLKMVPKSHTCLFSQRGNPDNQVNSAHNEHIGLRAVKFTNCTVFP